MGIGPGIQIDADPAHTTVHAGPPCGEAMECVAAANASRMVTSNERAEPPMVVPRSVAKGEILSSPVPTATPTRLPSSRVPRCAVQSGCQPQSIRAQKVRQAIATSLVEHGNSVHSMSEHNPYAPTAFSELTVVAVPDQPVRWLRRFLCVQVVVIICSLAVETYKHESIVGSGPIFSLIGLCLAVLSIRQRNIPAFVFGLSAIVLTGSVVFLINYNGWGPPEGDGPITLIVWLYSLFAVPAAWFLFTSIHKRTTEP